jgi:hypothetical protein
MKRLAIGLAGSLILFILSFGSARAQNSPFSGEIMDSQCAKTGSHEEMMQKHAIKTEKACTLGCVKNGGKFVLYNPDSKTTYQLNDQNKSPANTTVPRIQFKSRTSSPRRSFS